MRLTFIFFLLSLYCTAQTAYKLDFKIKGLKDTTALLGYYFGESTYARDTAKIDHQGQFSFTGNKKLDKGVYFVAVNKNRIFEMVVGDDQTFKMESDTIDYVKNMKVTGDIDNTIFFENMLNNMARHKEAEPYLAIIQDSTLADAEKVKAREEFKKINDRVNSYRKELIQKHPTTITAKLFAISQPITAPEPHKKSDGSIDSTFQLYWYRAHFFDHLDLDDDVMLRMPRPFYSEKVNEFLDKLFVPQSDTIIQKIDWLVAQAKGNTETYKYMVWTLLLKYQTPDIMGLDEVFVHLYDKYFATGEMDYWANAALKKNLKEHADRLRRSLIGHKGADLVMQDKDFQKRALYDIKSKYTIIFFFDPDCGHCKKETPKLVDFYEKNKKKLDVEVFAVSADTSMQKMRDYIKDMKMNWITVNGPRTYTAPYSELYDSMTTPTIYILDDKKMIIAKKIPTEKVEEFLINYEKHHKKNGQL